MLPILSLFDHSGRMADAYRRRGYDVIQVDLKHGEDVVLFKALGFPVRGVIAQPPCTHFAGSGARWWADKGDDALREGLALVDAALRIVMVHNPQWWVLENPVGRLSHFLGEPAMRFNPSDYGDPYTKKTCLWGKFNRPFFKPVEAVEGSMMWKNYGGKSERTKEMRSITPEGFAEAFAESNP